MAPGFHYLAIFERFYLFNNSFLSKNKHIRLFQTFLRTLWRFYTNRFRFIQGLMVR